MKKLMALALAVLLLMGCCACTVTINAGGNASAKKSEEAPVRIPAVEPPSSGAPDLGELDAEAAKAAALEHAGVKAEDAIFSKVKREIDDCTAQFELEFVVGEIRYEYEIDAFTGAVLSAEKESIYS